MAYVPVYILSGQSNTGRSLVSEMTGPEAAIYDKVYDNIFIKNSSGDPELMDAGVNTTIGNAGEFGCELSLMNNYGSGKKRYVMKFGVGNTDLATYWSSAGLSAMSTRMNQLLSYMWANSETPDIKAFIWMQGENDATNEAWADAYLSNLTDFFNAFKSFLDTRFAALGFGAVPNYKKVIGRINGELDGSEVYRDTVRQAQADYCAVSGNNAILIDTDSYPLKDGVHYSATGQIQFGNDIFAALPAEIPDPNVFGGKPNILVARETALFADLGINSTNTEIIYLVDNPLKSYLPGRTINGITGFEAGKGYYIIMKQDFHIEGMIPPFD